MLHEDILALLHWIAPVVCPFCQDISRNIVCEDCYNILPWLEDRCRQCAGFLHELAEHTICKRCTDTPPHFDRTYALFAYLDPIASAVGKLKFYNNIRFAKLFADIFDSQLLAGSIDKPDIVFPVPLHYKKMRLRGYNQSWEIAKRLRNVDADHLFLEKIKYTKPQVTLKKNKRLINVKNSFKIMQPVKDLHIAILDDVMTTGATVEEIAKCLKLQGATRVDIWCVCHG